MAELAAEGLIVRNSTRPIASSSIAIAVRHGAPAPDVSTVGALKRTLLNAKSIGYSASGSGLYLSTELFPKLDLVDAIREKCRRIEGERVGAVVARGDVEIGFQQMSELLPMTGIDVVGLIPPEVQRTTVLSAGVPASSADPDTANLVIRSLLSDEARAILLRAGLDRPHG
jgi:molybdate transport system substrate-binding protein